MDSPARRIAPLALLAAIAFGCEPASLQTTPTTIPKTPDSVLEPRAIDEAPPAKPEDAGQEKTKVEPADPGSSATKAPEKPASVELTRMKYDAYRSKAVAHPEAKLTVVDAWATWCAPCMENFPHLVEMHRKYADKGLVCVSLSLDYPDDPKAFEKAHAFLKEQDATFLNVLLDEEQGDAFDKLDLNGVPAVLIYDPSGKEIRRFTGDDPNRLFTYAQVEDVVARLLRGEALPADAPGEVHKDR
ncbi:MAG: TlpA disulfide reductase family protein [Isosphaeraceae bacterium]